MFITAEVNSPLHCPDHIDHVLKCKGVFMTYTTLSSFFSFHNPHRFNGVFYDIIYIVVGGWVCTISNLILCLQYPINEYSYKEFLSYIFLLLYIYICAMPLPRRYVEHFCRCEGFIVYLFCFIFIDNKILQKLWHRAKKVKVSKATFKATDIVG